MNPQRIAVVANTHQMILAGVTNASVVILEPGGGFFATFRDSPSGPPVDLENHQRILSQQFDIRYPTPVDCWIWSDRDLPVVVYQ